MVKKPITGWWLSALAIFALLGVFSTSCKKEKKLNNSDQPTFSTDTIIFDTVFTTVGSVTNDFKVYNRYNGVMGIDNIYLEKGDASNYRLNVDGVPGRSFSNIEIPAKDSIFIFVEVTVDPNSATTPLIVTDRVVFERGGQKQYVELVAWGQDAYFFKPSSGSAFLMPCGATLLTDKPNVFYGTAIVDEGCNLTIPAGAKLYFHPNSTLLVYRGSLNINGTNASPVVMQGDRLEYDYREVSGQWQGVRLIQPQNSNIIHTVIKNGFFGLWVDTTFSSSAKVTVQKTEISNMAGLGIYGNAGARIDASNCLVTNCGEYALALTYGGVFRFNHCTIANYWNGNPARTTSSFYFKNWFSNPDGSDNIRDIDVAMDNCIVYGNIENEFSTDLKTAGVMNYVFRNCFIRSTQDLSDGAHYISIHQNVDPLFENVTGKNFKLNAASGCRDAANTLSPVPTTDDIEDKPYVGTPDIGCYEY